MPTNTLHRRGDTATAIAAAEKILPKVNRLQFQVLDAWRRYHRRNGRGATDGEIEALPEFADFRPTTVRKRRLELQRKGFIRATDEKRAGMTVFEPLSDAQVREAMAARTVGALF